MSTDAVESLPQNNKDYFCYFCDIFITINPSDTHCPHCNLRFIEQLAGTVEDITNMLDISQRVNNANAFYSSIMASGRGYQQLPGTVEDITNRYDISQRGNNANAIYSSDMASGSGYQQLSETVEDITNLPETVEDNIQLPEISPANLRKFLDKFSNRLRRNNIEGPSRFSTELLLSRLSDFVIQFIDGTDIFNDGSDGYIAHILRFKFGIDYLEEVISQILNQLQGADPQALSKDRMNDISKESITIEHMNAKLQCAICFEIFQLKEKVRKLDCSHYYHKKCIFPWVRRHATCPVCRKNLNDEIVPSVDTIMRTLRAIAVSRNFNMSVFYLSPPVTDRIVLNHDQNEFRLDRHTVIDYFESRSSMESRNVSLTPPTFASFEGSGSENPSDDEAISSDTSSCDGVERSQTSAMPSLSPKYVPNEHNQHGRRLEVDPDSDPSSDGSRNVRLSPNERHRSRDSDSSSMGSRTDSLSSNKRRRRLEVDPDSDPSSVGSRTNGLSPNERHRRLEVDPDSDPSLDGSRNVSLSPNERHRSRESDSSSMGSRTDSLSSNERRRRFEVDPDSDPSSGGSRFDGLSPNERHRHFEVDPDSDPSSGGSRTDSLSPNERCRRFEIDSDSDPSSAGFRSISLTRNERYQRLEVDPDSDSCSVGSRTISLSSNERYRRPDSDSFSVGSRTISLSSNERYRRPDSDSSSIESRTASFTPSFCSSCDVSDNENI